MLLASVVYTASCSFAYCRGLSFYAALFSRANSRLYIRKKCGCDSTVSRRLLVNVENMLQSIIIKFSRNLEADGKKDLQLILRYRLFPLTKMYLRSSLLISAVKLKISGIVARENR